MKSKFRFEVSQGAAHAIKMLKVTTSLHLAFIALVLNPAHVLTNAICAFRYQLIVNTPPV